MKINVDDGNLVRGPVKEKIPCKNCATATLRSECELHPNSIGLCYPEHLKKEHVINWDKWHTGSGFSLDTGSDFGPTPRKRKIEAAAIS